MEFKLQLAAFDFRADRGGKLKLELHPFFHSLWASLTAP